MVALQSSPSIVVPSSSIIQRRRNWWRASTLFHADDDKAEENSPGVGARDCSIVDDELEVALIEMLGDVARPLNESLASTSELIGMPSLLDSWQTSEQAALLEEPLSFECGCCSVIIRSGERYL